MLKDIDELIFHSKQIFDICNKLKADNFDLGIAEPQSQNIVRINPGERKALLLSQTEGKVLNFLREAIKKNPGRCYFQKKEMGEVLGIQFETMRTCITRLKSKGYIKLVDYLNGPNVGCSSYDITPKGWSVEIKKQIESSEDLIGLQEKCLEFIRSRSSQSFVTDKLRIEDFVDALNCPPGSVKTTIRRLEEKGFIRQAAHKNGRGGWIKLEVT